MLPDTPIDSDGLPGVVLDHPFKKHLKLILEFILDPDKCVGSSNADLRPSIVSDSCVNVNDGASQSIAATVASQS